MTIHSIQDGIQARARRESRRIASVIADLQVSGNHEAASAKSYELIMALPNEIVPYVMDTFRAELERERRKRGL